MSALAPSGRVIIQVTVTVTDLSGEPSARIANAVGARLASVTSDLSPRRQDGSRSVEATVLATAEVPPRPSWPNILRNLDSSLSDAGLNVVLVDTDLRRRFDIVLDSPPLLPVTDGAILGRLAGTTFVVVGTDRLHRSQLREALGSLSTAGVGVSGVVLTKVTPHTFGPYEDDASDIPRSDSPPTASTLCRRSEGRLPHEAEKEVEHARG